MPIIPSIATTKPQSLQKPRNCKKEEEREGWKKGRRNSLQRQRKKHLAHRL